MHEGVFQLVTSTAYRPAEGGESSHTPSIEGEVLDLNQNLMSIMPL